MARRRKAIVAALVLGGLAAVVLVQLANHETQRMAVHGMLSAAAVDLNTNRHDDVEARLRRELRAMSIEAGEDDVVIRSEGDRMAIEVRWRRAVSFLLFEIPREMSVRVETTDLGI